MQPETKDVDVGGSPLGVITFLFTDIEASTRRWEADPATMRAVMERHDLPLTGAIETNGGRVVLERGEGDSFFAVFERPAAAVSAALDGQRALAAEPWPDSSPVKVRMAIHTGEADAQIRGPEVNRAAHPRRRPRRPGRGVERIRVADPRLPAPRGVAAGAGRAPPQGPLATGAGLPADPPPAAGPVPTTVLAFGYMIASGK